MKNYIIASILMLLAGSAAAEGIRFFEGTWNEALEAAKKEDKLIFVDAYAVWCGPCKRMAKEVFPDDKAGEFYNRHFINMQIDMERGMGLAFGKQYPVSAFPTLFFIDASGKVVHKVMGAQSVEAFISIGKKAISMDDKSQDYAAEYEQGNREPALVLNYLRALNKTGKSSLKIANDYLRSQPDLSTDFNLNFILEAATEADSRIFEWLIEYRSQIARVASEDEVNQRILDACRATAQKAIEFQSEDLVKEAIAKVKKHYPQRLTAFELQTWMAFYEATNNAANYAKTAKSYAKREAYDDARELQSLVTVLVKRFDNDKNAMSLAEDLAKRAAAVSEVSVYYLIYADVLQRNGKQAQAIEAARKAMSLARAEGDTAVRAAERFIQKLEG
ncbi:MAG TPA: thioredoxin family protein [Saprospiraceae bacterium]|nr:thioredoxin family protein [Saprospiraceae bacterium]HMP23841.1 thioredoxin family protein [Saprospiraceae bacterium]